MRPASVAELRRQVAAGEPLGFIWTLGHLQCLMLQERYDDALAGLDATIAAARENGTPSALPWPLAARAEVRRRTGRLGEAAADAAEALDLARDTGQQGLAGYALAVLAFVDAVLGRRRRLPGPRAPGVADRLRDRRRSACTPSRRRPSGCWSSAPATSARPSAASAPSRGTSPASRASTR